MGRQRIESRLERERCEDGLGKNFCSVAAIGAVAGVAGAAINASSASDAASAQSGASQQAQMMQYAAAQQMRQDLSPWTSSGGAAQSALNRYLGLGVGNTGVTSTGLQTGMTPAQVREALLSQYTRTNTLSPTQNPYGTFYVNSTNYPTIGSMTGDPNDTTPNNTLGGTVTRNPSGFNTFNSNNGYSDSGANDWSSTGAGSTYQQSTVDEEGLNAAIQAYYAEQERMNAAMANDPTYGSLLQAYRNGEEFDSGPAFSFTGQDLASEPGYQFGLNQGTQGIERAQASRGNFLSGAAMKELAKYNEDYAGTKFNDAFNRSLSTYNTNLTRRQNEWNTNLNAYENNRARIYDFLTGVSRTGQNSAAQVGTANNNTASQMASNALAAGNANAAGIIASGNAMTSGINTAVNSINSAGGWNALLGSKPSVYSAGGSAGTGFGSGAAFGNQDLGINF